MSSEARRKRGFVRRSITNLGKRLTDLEVWTDKTEAYHHAQRLFARLETLDTEFKAVQYEIVSAINESDEESIAAEQEALDRHDEDIDALSVRIQRLLLNTNPSSTESSGEQRSLSRSLAVLEKSLQTINAALESLPPESDDLALIQQYQEELSDVKTELTTCRDCSYRLELPEDHDLCVKLSELKTLHFYCCHSIKKILNTISSSTSPLSTGTDAKGLKIPKLEAPTFDGDILNWTHFWEQFSISIDEHANLSDAEKFVYLQHSLKGGSAKSVIQGLSGTGEHYAKAVECLKARYDRPRLIHQSHVKVIMETPSLRDGSGKELRRLHDTLQQHLRALDAADCEPLSHFITSIIQLKLDPGTLFEWQKHTQMVTDVPHFQDILEFIDLRARASEATFKRAPRVETPLKKISTNFAANPESPSSQCVLCKPEKHPLYYCSKFKGMSQDQRLSVVRSNGLCMNCLKAGHFLKECKSSHHCRSCQKPHHTLLHIDARETNPPSVISSNTSMGTLPDTLLMTCQVLVQGPDGSKVKARALLDSASSSSFISERLVQSLGIPRSHHKTTVSGVAGLTSPSPFKSVATVNILSTQPSSHRRITTTAVVVPRVTCDLPLNPISFKPDWTHLDDILLADPQFNSPGRIDLLLGVDIYVESLLHGRRTGPPGSPVALKTIFGWVLAGKTSSNNSCHVTSHHVSTSLTDDDILRRFWEIEELTPNKSSPSIEDQSVLNHFKNTHCQNQKGRFIVPLPRCTNIGPLGESRSQAVRRFMMLERSLLRKAQHAQMDSVMREYLDLGHAEQVPVEDLKKPPNEVFYFPIHAVYKTSSTTTKVRAVFDASAKSTTGVSLNDCLLVGPTVHSSLIDVLLRFRLHRIAITTDISKMYRAIELVKRDRDLHRFVWRSDPSEVIKDYRMTRVTFGVSASSFVANMCVKQNALNLAHEYPLAAKAVKESFYVDDGFTIAYPREFDEASARV